MKPILIALVIALVGVGGMLFYAPVTEVRNPEIIEKPVEVDALQKRIKDAQESAKADIEAKAKEAYDARYKQAMDAIEAQVLKDYEAEVKARRIEKEKEAGSY